HQKKILSKKNCSYWLSVFKKNRITLTIRIVSEIESKALNNRYRKINKPTNILSFQIESNPLIGDLVLCHPIIKKEARAQKKKINDHYAHLLIHGCLHLMGFDHEDEDDAVAMENRERLLLKKLGIKNPYKSNIMKVDE
ncbi:MAG: hypothetical protein ABS06_05175, partial [Methylophilales bacterium BACL14 MAG-120910-bin43]